LREYQARGRWLQGRLAMARGNLDGALEALENARARAEAFGGRLILWRADAALGDVHLAAGHNAEARRAYRRAWDTLRAIAATLPDEAAREDMLAAPAAVELKEKLKTKE
jgi:tetratricopeptide (TPR) repeat protein